MSPHLLGLFIASYVALLASAYAAMNYAWTYAVAAATGVFFFRALAVVAGLTGLIAAGILARKYGLKWPLHAAWPAPLLLLGMWYLSR